MERRFANSVYLETRDNKRVIRGLASPVYDGSPGSEYNLYDEVYERFAPGAFNEYLQEPRDIVALINHDASRVLGRTPHTLRVWTDARGLSYEIDPPDTQEARDLMVLLSRGDVKGSSFQFCAKEVRWKRDGNKEIREVHKATLHDVSVVTTPAYSGSQAFLRSADERKFIENERREFFEQCETEKRFARWQEIEKLLHR